MKTIVSKSKTKQPPQEQELPGSQRQMQPAPVDEDKEYSGTGRLKKKIAIITGADSGIGRSVAILFAKEGADISMVYLNEHDDAQDTMKRIGVERSRRPL